MGPPANREEFVMRTRISRPAREVFDWHERPGALERLTPPWERAMVKRRAPDLSDGGRTLFTLGAWPFRVDWLAEHRDRKPGRGFTDVQVRGPFASWTHRHSFIPCDEFSCVLEDRIEYRLPLHAISRCAAGGAVRARLERMFRYRHALTARDLDLRARRRPLRIAVSGSTGLIGRRLVPFLSTQGHDVTVLVRDSGAGRGRMRWDPATGAIDGSLDGFDALIHLAGEPAGTWPWTPARKRRILESRVSGTSLLAEHCASLPDPPSVFVSASAVGYYGDCGPEVVTEDREPGRDFLSGVCREWERAASSLSRARTRLVTLRIGVVLDPAGGALGRLLPAFRAGAGAVIGSGAQYVSWISAEDCIRAIEHALFSDHLAGPVNLAAPAPATARELSDCLARVLGRPRLLRLPSPAVSCLFGRMGREVLLSGSRASHERLSRSGFEFFHRELEPALRFLLGKELPRREDAP